MLLRSQGHKLGVGRRVHIVHDVPRNLTSRCDHNNADVSSNARSYGLECADTGGWAFMNVLDVDEERGLSTVVIACSELDAVTAGINLLKANI